jgi:PAS domain S-box-containing protein
MYLSQQMIEFVGAPRAELQGDGWLRAVHPDDKERAHAAWRQAVESRTTYRVEYRMRRHDGVYRWFEARAVPLYAEDGAIVQWFGANTDIQEQRETREALQAEKVRLEKLAAASPQLLHSINASPTGHLSFTYASPAFTRLFGLSTEELAADATCLISMYNAEDNQGIAASVLESARDLTAWKHEWRINVPGRGEIWIEAHSMPVREADGSTTWHGTLNDITERKRVDQEIRALNSELEQRVRARTAALEQANRDLESFSYSVSHDLREPLRAMHGFSRALDEDFGELLPAEGRSYLASIRAAALRMGRLIDDLLDFSRTGRQPVTRRLVDMRALVAECLCEFEPGTESSREIVIGDLPPCDADPALLRQALVNLIGNAIKYSRQRKLARIEIGALRNEQGETVYYVRDNGTGFDMRYASRLFGVFQRLHRQEEFEGTGVGLAIVQRVIARHGGRVWAESAPDRGATFYFTIGRAD